MWSQISSLSYRNESHCLPEKGRKHYFIFPLNGKYKEITEVTLVFLRFFRYPRHRKLISINKIYTGRRNREFNLRHDWNSLLSDRSDLLFQRISRELYPNAEDYPRYLSLFEKELGLKVKYGVDIARIKALGFRGDQGYILTDQNGVRYQCR